MCRTFTRCFIGLAVAMAITSRVEHASSRTPPDPCEEYGVFAPSWSPDGTRLAAIHWGLIFPYSILEMSLGILDADGNGVDGCYVGTAWSRPAWSPSGSEIAFNAGGLRTAPSNSCTYPEFRLVTRSFLVDPAWSPDGSSIAGTLGNDVVIVSAAGGDPVVLVRGAAQPAWSPDGRLLAFSADWDGSHRIYTWDFDHQVAIQITTGNANDSAPTWSPDGRFIAFASDRAGGTNIWSVRADGGSEPVQVTHGGGETSPAWSPDGTKIAYLVMNGSCTSIGVTSDIRVVGVESRSWSSMKQLFR